MFLITKDMLKAKGASAADFVYFCGRFGAAAEYQVLLNVCAADGCDNFARWLLEWFGCTVDVKKITGDLISDKSIYCCGRLEVSGTIYTPKDIHVGDSIQAGGAIEAGGCIVSGCEIEAGTYIKAGSHIRAEESITAGEEIDADGFIDSKMWIHSGQDVYSEEGIRAGCDIKANGYVITGLRYGVAAGTAPWHKKHERFRFVACEKEPRDLRCGVYCAYE